MLRYSFFRNRKINKRNMLSGETSALHSLSGLEENLIGIGEMSVNLCKPNYSCLPPTGQCSCKVVLTYQSSKFKIHILYDIIMTSYQRINSIIHVFICELHVVTALVRSLIIYELMKSTL